MPKRYEFYSKLSKEEVFARFVSRSGWDNTKWGGSFYRKWIEFGRNGNAEFFLDVVGERDINLAKRKTHFFVGTVKEQGEKSIIIGAFPQKWINRIFIIVFLLLVGDIFLNNLFMGWILENLIPDVVLVSAAVVAMWLVWRTWYDTQIDRVLIFIQENLLE